MKRLLLILVLLSGCGAPPSPPTQTRMAWEYQLAQIREQVNQAEEEWRSKAIASYELEVRYENIDTIWMKMTVHAARLVEASCRDEASNGTAILSPSCDMFEENPQSFTIPGLFIRAREWISNAKGHLDLPVDMILRIELDSEHKYPKKLIWTQPEPFEWEVTSFKQLD